MEKLCDLPPSPEATAAFPSGFRRPLGKAFNSLLTTNRNPSVTLIGGGHGLSAALTALRGMEFDLTAIVAVSDDGGSSGSLRSAFGIPPPGDLRRCLLALSDAPADLQSLFAFRFAHDAGAGLAGHPLGNLILAALAEQAGGDFSTALDICSKLLQVRGRVLPVTLDAVGLIATLDDGSVVSGETAAVAVAANGRSIRQIALDNPNARPAPGVLEAVRNSDMVLIGPGSLYTSVLPPLLTPGVADAMRAREGRTVYLCNPVMQEGETDGYRASDHVRALLEHLGEGAIKSAVVHVEKNSSHPTLTRIVEADPENITAFGLSWIEGDLMRLFGGS